MLAPVIHFLPLTTIRRRRQLPSSGRVLVQVGQKVSPSDVIAESQPASRHLLFDVGRELGLPADEVDAQIHRKMGDQVSKGDVIAGPAGLLSRPVKAPSDGKIVAVGEGQVLMELDEPPFELKAGLSGTVTDLIPDRGAVIETTGALVQGIWGNGQVDKSLLVALSRSPAGELTSAQLDVSHRGAVILAGRCPRGEVLQAAIDIPVRGMILGSMPARLVPLAQKAPFPILLVEGFGRLPMNSLAFTLLASNEHREVIVNATALDRATGGRPEVIIPLPSSGSVPLPPETDTFTPGQRVLVRRGPHATQVGMLASLKSERSLFPSGIRAAAGVVQLEGGEQAVLPLANLEVIE